FDTSDHRRRSPAVSRRAARGGGRPVRGRRDRRGRILRRRYQTARARRRRRSHPARPDHARRARILGPDVSACAVSERADRIVSANDDPSVIRRCMDFGASGFIPKTLGIEDMRGAIGRVFEGGIWTPPDIELGAGSDAETANLMSRLASLTPQQVRVPTMPSHGPLNKQIAYE